MFFFVFYLNLIPPLFDDCPVVFFLCVVVQEKKHQLDNALKKSLQPDARKSVETWLEAANDSGTS